MRSWTMKSRPIRQSYRATATRVSFTYYFNKRETMYSATITHGEQITVTYIFRPDGKDNGAVNVMIRRDKLPQMNLPLTAML